jgi:hypothetical protein
MVALAVFQVLHKALLGAALVVVKVVVVVVLAVQVRVRSRQTSVPEVPVLPPQLEAFPKFSVVVGAVHSKEILARQVLVLPVQAEV